MDTHPVYRPEITLLTQVVLHLSLQAHAVTVLPHLQKQEQLFQDMLLEEQNILSPNEINVAFSSNLLVSQDQ